MASDADQYDVGKGELIIICCGQTRRDKVSTDGLYKIVGAFPRDEVNYSTVRKLHLAKVVVWQAYTALRSGHCYCSYWLSPNDRLHSADGGVFT